MKIINITPHGPDDGSVEPKHYSVDPLINHSLHLDRCYQFFYIYIYVCVCVCVYCHPRTDCFVVSQLFSVARHVGCLKLGSKPTQLYVRFSILPLSQQSTYASSGIIRHYVAAFVCLHFALPDNRVLNSFEELLHYASGVILMKNGNKSDGR